jgi:hypothetical protein
VPPDASPLFAVLPLLTYVAAAGLAYLVLRGLGPRRHHVLFWVFLAYSSPYALRFALQEAFAFPFASSTILGTDEFVRTTLLLGALLPVAALLYRLTYTLSVAGARREGARADAWIAFTREWGIVVYRYLWLVALACTVLGLFVRFVIQGDRFLLGFAADVESRQASMGWGFVPFILSQINVTILLVAVELRRPRSEFLALFLVQVALAVSSGSKAGFLIPLFYCLMFALHRRRTALNAARMLGVAAIGVVGLALGVIVRGYVEGGGWSLAALGSPVTLFGPALGRFFAFDIEQIMIARPGTYAPVIPDFQAYMITAAVPAALWAGKPLNPCLLLADAVGFPFVSCVAPGWVGGVLLLVGPMGVLLAPVLVGVITARIASKAVAREAVPSLRQPLVFSVGLLWLGLVNEGVYYQVVPIFLPILLGFILVYLTMVLMHGRLGWLPVFRMPDRVSRTAE